LSPHLYAILHRYVIIRNPAGKNQTLAVGLAFPIFHGQLIEQWEGSFPLAAIYVTRWQNILYVDT